MLRATSLSEVDDLEARQETRGDTQMRGGGLQRPCQGVALGLAGIRSSAAFRGGEGMACRFGCLAKMMVVVSRRGGNRQRPNIPECAGGGGARRADRLFGKARPPACSHEHQGIAGQLGEYLTQKVLRYASRFDIGQQCVIGFMGQIQHALPSFSPSCPGPSYNHILIPVTTLKANLAGRDVGVPGRRL